jgi:hypothetical protein
MDTSMRITVIGVATILALFLLAETASVAQSLGRSTTPPADTITVQGSGEATLAPDIARVSFTVQHTAKAVADAQAATTKQGNAALAAVEQVGVAAKDVKTTSYNITPQYTYTSCPANVICPRTSTVSGYQVSQTIQVTLRDLTKVGDLLAALGTLGVQNVSGPSFALADTNAGPDAARADAIANAKSQAALLAGQLGVHLGRLVSFNENSPYPIYSATKSDMALGAGGAVAPSPAIPAGENTYTATVSLTYEIR